MWGRRAGFTLIELLVVISIIGLLIAVLLPAVQMVRVAQRNLQCTSHLKQLGVALQSYHGSHGSFPPGMVSPSSNLANGDATGFTKLLAYLEQQEIMDRYNFSASWYDEVNYQAVASQIPLLYCPANRTEGQMNLTTIAEIWATPLPPLVGTTDYAFNKGASAVLTRNSHRIAEELQGVFDVNSRIKIVDIKDGTTHTIAMGEATGGPGHFLVRSTTDPATAVIDSATGQSIPIEQAWSAGCVTSEAYPYYGSVFGVTSQGNQTSPRYEPMSPANRLVAPTIDGNANFENDEELDWVSGFRSLHSGGCNFLFCDGSVRFLANGIDLETYRRLSTRADNL